jgi:CRISPR-associated protein Csd1
VAKLRKGDPKEQGAAVGLEKEMQSIVDGLESDLPRSLKLEDQGRFAIGYYHQRSDRYRKRDAGPGATEEDPAQ